MKSFPIPYVQVCDATAELLVRALVEVHETARPVYALVRVTYLNGDTRAAVSSINGGFDAPILYADLPDLDEQIQFARDSQKEFAVRITKPRDRETLEEFLQRRSLRELHIAILDTQSNPLLVE